MSRFQYQKQSDQHHNDEIVTEDFWPNIRLSDFQNKRRIPTEYDAGQQRDALIRAINMVLIELNDWQKRAISGGKTNAKQCGHVIDGTGAAAALFVSAVYDRAKATLLAHFKTVNRREEANNLAKEERSTYDELLRESQLAIRGILEIRTTSVMLL